MISVIIPVFNREDTVRRAVLSVLKERSKQTTEVIVVDDGSTDSTVAQVKDLLIRIAFHSKNLGFSAARNTGLSHAKGDWITFLDSDDELEPHSIERRLRWLVENPAETVVFGSADVRLACGIGKYRRVERFKRYFPSTPTLVSHRDFLARDFRIFNLGQGLFHRKVFDSIGGFKVSGRGEDREFYGRLLEQKSRWLIPVIAIRYALHRDNLWNHLPVEF